MVGFLSSIVPTTPVAAEYACGTYSADNYSSDCTDTTIQMPSSSPSTSSKAASASTSPTTSNTDTNTTQTTVGTSQAPETNIPTKATQETSKSPEDQGFQWWLWIEGITLVLLLAAIVVIVSRVKRRHAK